jgi:hypothetical protein
LEKSKLLASLETKQALFDALAIEMKAIQREIAEIDHQIDSPTFKNLEIARSCVYVGPKKTGKYRQLHIKEDEELYYLSDSRRKVLIDKDREIFQNAEVRLAGKSIWDGPKIARHAGDVDENPEDLEESFGIEEVYSEAEDSVIASP